MIELRNQLAKLELIRERLANKEWHGVVRLSDSVMFEFMKKFHQDMIEIVDKRRGVITDMKSMEPVVVNPPVPEEMLATCSRNVVHD